MRICNQFFVTYKPTGKPEIGGIRGVLENSVAQFHWKSGVPFQACRQTSFLIEKARGIEE